jgi:hypothetical protein
MLSWLMAVIWPMIMTFDTGLLVKSRVTQVTGTCDSSDSRQGEGHWVRELHSIQMCDLNN